jgi:heme exporter protein D
MNIGNWEIDYFYVLLLLGIVLVIIASLNQARARLRRSAQKQKKRDSAVKAAQEAERKTQMLTALPKAKVQASVPMPDPLGIPFTGMIQGNAAKWEAEIHKLGRQIIGQIDSKMAALQAMTLDANRTANRLEILVEHLEQFARTQMQGQGQGQPIAETSETVIPAAESPTEVAPLTEVLEELTDELEDIRTKIKQSTAFREEPQQATILRLAELQKGGLQGNDRSAVLRSEAAMLANYGLDSTEIARRLNISQGEVEIMLQT